MLRALALVMTLLAAVARAEPVRLNDWFALDAAALEDWRVAQADAARVTLERRAPPTGEVRTVLVLYPRASEAYDVAMTRLLTDFAARPVPLRFVAADWGRDPARGAALLAEAAAQGHALIFAMGSETAAWLHEIRDRLTTPVVTVCAKDPVLLGQLPDYETGGGGMIAYTSLNPPLAVQMAYLRAVRPGLRGLGVLVDAQNDSAVETQAQPIIAAARAEGVDAFAIEVTDPARARDQLAAALPQALARMRARDPDLAHSLFWITGSTAVFEEIETLVAHAAHVPLLAVAPEVVRAGPHSAALAVGVSFTSNAHLAGVYGAEILSGRARPGDLPAGVVSPPDVAVNLMRARAIGMALPFRVLEAASWVYDVEGRPVRLPGQPAR